MRVACGVVAWMERPLSFCVNLQILCLFVLLLFLDRRRSPSVQHALRECAHYYTQYLYRAVMLGVVL